MASLLQIFVHADNAVVSFSFPNLQAFDPYGGCGIPESVQASAVKAKLPITLRRLCILLGPGLGPIDDQALSLILEDITTTFPCLASFSITSHADSWITRRADLVLKRVPPSVWRTIHVIDPVQSSQASVTILRRGPRVKHVSSAVIPLCRLYEKSITDALCIDLRKLNKLAIIKPLDLATYNEHRDAILASFSRFLPRARGLRMLSLPLDISSDLAPVLFLASALLQCSEIQLSCSSTYLVSTQYSITSALVSGLHQFDHLKKLVLPTEVLCPPLHTCLADLRGLQDLKIVATASTTPGRLPAPRAGQSAVLRTLQVLGPFSHLKWALRAFAHPEAKSLRSIYVESKCLADEEEMRHAFRVMIKRCPMVKILGICIQGINSVEKMDWLDLSLLGNLELRDFVIRHPKPLALSDSDILRFLVAWPRAKHISLNPRPTLYPWVIRGGALAPSPTLNCLIHVAERSRTLRHFGSYLNSLLPRTPAQSHDRVPSLKELDVGSSRRSKQGVALIKALFPNATVQ